MVQYDEIPATKVRKRKREVMMDRSAEDKPTAEEGFLICDDCKHSSIRPLISQWRNCQKIWPG